MATRHAQTQVHPGAANAQTIFTTNGAGYDIFDLIEVSTFHDGKDSKLSLQILVLLLSEQSCVLAAPLAWIGFLLTSLSAALIYFSPTGTSLAKLTYDAGSKLYRLARHQCYLSLTGGLFFEEII
jgi:hypothetical protein